MLKGDPREYPEHIVARAVASCPVIISDGAIELREVPILQPNAQIRVISQRGRFSKGRTVQLNNKTGAVGLRGTIIGV